MLTTGIVQKRVLPVGSTRKHSSLTVAVKTVLLWYSESAHPYPPDEYFAATDFALTSQAVHSASELVRKDTPAYARLSGQAATRSQFRRMRVALPDDARDTARRAVHDRPLAGNERVKNPGG